MDDDLGISWKEMAGVAAIFVGGYVLLLMIATWMMLF